VLPVRCPRIDGDCRDVTPTLSIPLVLPLPARCKPGVVRASMQTAAS
jgi:hypothetical protein